MSKSTTERYRQWVQANPLKVRAHRDRHYAKVRSQRESASAASIAKLMTHGFVRMPDYPAYLISVDGAIYSTHGRRVIKLRPGVKPGGYEFVGLRNSLGTTYEMVHRLVAIMFIDNPGDFPEINHLDGNKRNNVVANLEWCDRTRNMQHAYEIGIQKRGLHNHNSKLSADQVQLIRTAAGRYRDIGSSFGVSAQTVCNVKRRSRYGDVP